MGKWLDRVVKGKGNLDIFSEGIPKTSTDDVDRLPDPPDCLTNQGREVYREYIGEMLCPKHGSKLPLEAAQSLAIELVSCVPGNL